MPNFMPCGKATRRAALPVVVAALAALLGAAPGAAAPAPGAAAPRSGAAAPAVEGAWVRLPAVAGRPAAGYFTIKGGPQPDALIAAASPKAQRIEMHSTSMAGGVMRMRAEQAMPVPANGTLSFAPGGNHLMLFGLAAGMKPGDRLPITLSFQSGAKINTSAELRAVADATQPKAPVHQH